MIELDCNRIRSIVIKDEDLRFQDFGYHQSSQFSRIVSYTLFRAFAVIIDVKL